MEMFFLVYGGIAVLFFFLGGLAFLLTDLSGMFCYYQDGSIYFARWNKPVAQDTPRNRRRISRRMGGLILALDFLIGIVWLIILMQVR